MYGSTAQGILGAGGGGLFAVTQYTGTGETQSVVTGQNLSNSMIWLKATGTTSNHHVADSVRGVSKSVFPNSTSAESSSGLVTAFNSNGFSTGNTPVSEAWTAFTWLEQALYMDVVTYTGNGANRTIAHSLGVAPSMILVKRRDVTSADGWPVYHANNGNTKCQFLNTTIPAFTDSTYWNNTTPTSSVFSVANGVDVNANTGTFVAYLFAEKSGKSKFGTYTGNGGTNAITGLGFSPKAVMVKNTTTASNWGLIFNNGSSTYIVSPNSTIAASTAAGTATLNSDGFTLLSNSTTTNNNTDTYIYAAWG